MQPLSLLVIYDKTVCWKVFQTPTVPPGLLRETYFMPSLSSLMNPEEIWVSHPAVRCEGSWGKKMAIRSHVDWVLLARRFNVALVLLTLSLSAFDLLLLCIRKPNDNLRILTQSRIELPLLSPFDGCGSQGQESKLPPASAGLRPSCSLEIRGSSLSSGRKACRCRIGPWPPSRKKPQLD